MIPAIAAKIGGAQGTIAPCSGTTASAQTTCAQTFIQTFAKKAYRRPVDSTEVTNLMKLYAQGAMQDYATGVGLMIQSLPDRTVVRLPDRARTRDVHGGRDRQVPRYDADAVRGREPARVSAAGIDPR